jgi:hypothetical protein
MNGQGRGRYARAAHGRRKRGSLTSARSSGDRHLSARNHREPRGPRLRRIDMIATVPGNRSRMIFGTALARTKALPHRQGWAAGITPTGKSR